MKKTWEIVSGAEKSVLDQSSGIFQLFPLPQASESHGRKWFDLSICTIWKKSFNAKHAGVSYLFAL